MSVRFGFVELIDELRAQSVIDQLDGYRLDKQHVLRATLYSKFDELDKISDEYRDPDPQEYEPKDILRSWLLDTRPIDQYSILYGDTTEIYWNEPQRQPEHIHSQIVCISFSSFLSSFCFIII
jgi:translation initiation factor 3 subunit B